jgi:hypothetical protein
MVCIMWGTGRLLWGTKMTTHAALARSVAFLLLQKALRGHGWPDQFSHVLFQMRQAPAHLEDVSPQN